MIGVLQLWPQADGVCFPRHFPPPLLVLRGSCEWVLQAWCSKGIQGMVTYQLTAINPVPPLPKDTLDYGPPLLAIEILVFGLGKAPGPICLSLASCNERLISGFHLTVQTRSNLVWLKYQAGILFWVLMNTIFTLNYFILKRCRKAPTKWDVSISFFTTGMLFCGLCSSVFLLFQFTAKISILVLSDHKSFPLSSSESSTRSSAILQQVCTCAGISKLHTAGF